MPRRIRLLEKKRGERRTGSPWAGRLGEAVFYAFFLVVGFVGGAYCLFAAILPELRANQYVVESTCRVVDKCLGQRMHLGSLRYRPEVQIEYQVDGKTWPESVWAYDAAYSYRFDKSNAEAILDEFEVGQEYCCWYDPRNPVHVVLVRYHWLPWGILLVAGAFSLFGAIGLVYSLIHSRVSVERLMSRVSARETPCQLKQRGHRPKKEPPIYPAVPSVDNIVNSPGTQLAYRLPIDAFPGWRLVGIGTAAILWNAVVAFMAYYLIRRIFAGQPSLLWTITLLPFALGGIWLAVAWVRQLLLTTGIGVTRVEVEDHPFLPGETYEVGLAQAGRMKMNRLDVLLVCEERATYHQGTDTRRARQRVYEQVVFARENFDIEPGATFEKRFDLTIPEQAMHSLAADHNEVLWALIVRGDVAHWPDYGRRFPVCVYPAISGANMQ